MRPLSNIVAAFRLPGGADVAVIWPQLWSEGNKGLLFHRLREFFVKPLSLPKPRPKMGQSAAATGSISRPIVIGIACAQGE